MISLKFSKNMEYLRRSRIFGPMRVIVCLFGDLLLFDLPKQTTIDMIGLKVCEKIRFLRPLRPKEVEGSKLGI